MTFATHDTPDKRVDARPDAPAVSGGCDAHDAHDAHDAGSSERLVLVVDDSASAVKLYRSIVAPMGCDVAQAASLVDAIRWLREGRRPELIVLSDQAANVGPIDAARATRALEAFCGARVIVVAKPLRLAAFTALARSRLGAVVEAAPPAAVDAAPPAAVDAASPATRTPDAGTKP